MLNITQKIMDKVNDVSTSIFNTSDAWLCEASVLTPMDLEEVFLTALENSTAHLGNVWDPAPYYLIYSDADSFDRYYSIRGNTAVAPVLKGICDEFFSAVESVNTGEQPTFIFASDPTLPYGALRVRVFYRDPQESGVYAAWAE